MSSSLSTNRPRPPRAHTQDHFAATVDHCPYPIIFFDRAGLIIEFNAAAEATFGHRRDDAVHESIVELLIARRWHPRVQPVFDELHDNGTSPVIGKRLRGIATRADGSEFPIEYVLRDVTRGSRAAKFALYARDITRRTRAAQEAMEYRRHSCRLAAELLVAEERERQRLAADLHDGLSQTISLMQMKLAVLRRAPELPGAAVLEEIEALLGDANRAARQLTFELSPPVLRDFGLGPAVEWLVDSIHDRYGLEITFSDDGLPKSTNEQAAAILFRGVREALINVAKHAQASMVRVLLRRTGDRVEAVVEDDGVGLRHDPKKSPGTGLFSLRQRLHHIGGQLHCMALHPRGTKVSMTAPLEISRRSSTRV